MTQPVSRRVVQAFYQAYSVRDAVRMADFLDDDIEWLISGPKVLLPYCGMHRGKAAVVDLFRRQIPAVFELRAFEPELVLIDGDCAALYGYLGGIQCSSGRRLRYRHAQFVRFRNDKVVSVRAMLDSLDFAEQWLGHPLYLGAPPVAPDESESDIVAV